MTYEKPINTPFLLIFHKKWQCYFDNSLEEVMNILVTNILKKAINNSKTVLVSYCKQQITQIFVFILAEIYGYSILIS